MPGNVAITAFSEILFLIIIFNLALLLANYDGLEEFYGLKNS